MVIFRKIATYISIYKIIKFIKKSNKNSYIIGNEMVSIYCLLYNKFKYMPNFNITSSPSNIYIILLRHTNYKKLKISDFLNDNIDFSLFFSLLNNKILKLKNKHLWHYLRGYYINELDIYNTNLNGDKKQFWFLLYDFHDHYLLFIYSIMVKNYKNIRDVDLLLNNCYDPHSINDITDDMNYKMLFIHDPNKFNDSIKNVLNMFYYNITSESQLFSNDDIEMYRKYISYLNN